MVLNQRERKIAIAVGALIALLILGLGVVKPYFESRREIADAVDAANAELRNADVLAKRQVQMRKILKEMVAGGLDNSDNEAQSRLGNNLEEWAQEAGVNVTQLNLASSISQSTKNTPEAKFHLIGFQLTGTGPLSTLARLLWRIETASMPIRVSAVQISPRNGKEGQDDLQFVLTVSTLCRVADDKNTRGTGATADLRGGL